MISSNLESKQSLNKKVYKRTFNKLTNGELIPLKIRNVDGSLFSGIWYNNTDTIIYEDNSITNPAYVKKITIRYNTNSGSNQIFKILTGDGTEITGYFNSTNTSYPYSIPAYYDNLKILYNSSVVTSSYEHFFREFCILSNSETLEEHNADIKNWLYDTAAQIKPKANIDMAAVNALELKNSGQYGSTYLYNYNGCTIYISKEDDHDSIVAHRSIGIELNYHLPDRSEFYTFMTEGPVDWMLDDTTSLGKWYKWIPNPGQTPYWTYEEVSELPFMEFNSNGVSSTNGSIFNLIFDVIQPMTIDDKFNEPLKEKIYDNSNNTVTYLKNVISDLTQRIAALESGNINITATVTTSGYFDMKMAYFKNIKWNNSYLSSSNITIDLSSYFNMSALSNFEIYKVEVDYNPSISASALNDYTISDTTVSNVRSIVYNSSLTSGSSLSLTSSDNFIDEIRIYLRTVDNTINNGGN